ncbi:uncharacterized protein [Euphorbia lathyris]|uniref:uncharacterized protein n=1 Tax=Euphorbia lathyris TaxID=212925 RepID=UPI0033143B8C
MLPEIKDLFSKLALYLQTTTSTSPSNDQFEEDDSYSIDLSISKLNQSLNLTGDATGVRVLDTALSIMCFKAPQVFDSTIEYMMKTIFSVLSSSIICQSLRFGKEEFLLIGSSISKRNCLEFIEGVNDIIAKLDERGMPSHSLSCAVTRVAVSTSSCNLLVPPMYFLDAKSTDTRSISSIQKLLSYLPREFSSNNHEIPLRLLSWYLDPLTLKNDIMVILEGTMQRPFLSLSKEFCERMEWRNILMCLVISPIMFIHTRALLHNWFLLTGLGSVLEILSELVAVILDINSRPTFWGISIELGSKLPLYSAYFPYQNSVQRILAGPLSSSSFLHLSQKICESVTVREQFGQFSKPSAVKISSIDSKSLWALAICFPDWFYFASVLLFCNSSSQKCFQLKCVSEVYRCGQTSGMQQPSSAAARYIAWILSPHSKSHQDMLFDGLTKISKSWDLKQIGSGSSRRGPASNRKKLKKLKLNETEDDFSLTNEYQSQVFSVWLREFQAILKSGVELVNDSSSSSQDSMLLRRVPLGILIAFPNYVKEDGFELLLHYAATGKMLHLTNKNNRMGYSKQNFGELENIATNIECTKKEAVTVICLVFSLTDIVERMSTSLFKNGKNEMDIFCVVKLRVSRYLIKCIKRLMQSITDEDGDVMPTDLHDKLEHWRHQGQEMLKLDKDLDDIIKGLSHTLVSL